MTATAPRGIRPHDFLGIDDQLTEDERLVRDTARAFARDRVLPHVADWFEAGILPGNSPASSASSACWACT